MILEYTFIATFLLIIWEFVCPIKYNVLIVLAAIIIVFFACIKLLKYIKSREKYEPYDVTIIDKLVDDIATIKGITEDDTKMLRSQLKSIPLVDANNSYFDLMTNFSVHMVPKISFLVVIYVLYQAKLMDRLQLGTIIKKVQEANKNDFVLEQQSYLDFSTNQYFKPMYEEIINFIDGPYDIDKESKYKYLNHDVRVFQKLRDTIGW